MSYDPEEEARKAAAARRPLPGNYRGETLRQYCGLSAHRARGKHGFKERGVSAQTLFRAIGKHAPAKTVRKEG